MDETASAWTGMLSRGNAFSLITTHSLHARAPSQGCRVSLKISLGETRAYIWSSSLAFCYTFTATNNILLALPIITVAYYLLGTMLTPSKRRTALVSRRRVMLFQFKSTGQMKCFPGTRGWGGVGKKHPLNIIHSEIHLSKTPFLMRAPAVTPF